MDKSIGSNRIMILGAVLSLLLLSGCLLPNTKAIKEQEAIIAAGMEDAEKLLLFEEVDALASFQPTYQPISDRIENACANLSRLDKNKQYVTQTTKDVCENREDLDDCFFQLESIKTKIKSKNTDVDLDTLAVLCRDLRQLEYGDELETFTSQYKNYTAWLKAEKDISAEWTSIVIELWNVTYEPPAGAKLSSYFEFAQDSMAKVKGSLQRTKEKCALKNQFKTTDAEVEKLCNNVDDYLNDLSKTDSVVLDVFEFFGAFETGTITIDDEFIEECYSLDEQFIEAYEAELFRDTKPKDANETNFTEACESMEELSAMFSDLGIPLIFENGELSSTTKNELFKAKTVYIQSNYAVGSGVIMESVDGGYYILTNAHVVLEYNEWSQRHYLPNYVRVEFYDGKIGFADSLAYSRDYYDLALLYVPSSGYYPTATYYGDYYPSAGDKVVAVGNPYGLEFSVTQGVVSGVRDTGCGDEYCYGWAIQTDAAVNPGNSGGGLWDYDTGYLIGINSFKLTEAEGLNFAISMYQYSQIEDTFEWLSLD